MHGRGNRLRRITLSQNALQNIASAMVTDRLSVSRTAAMIISMATLSKVAWQQS